MGRSQVLYNRTKGRYKTRSGQPPQPQEQAPPSTAGRGGGGRNHNHRPPRHTQTPQPQQQQPSSPKYRPKLDESILLSNNKIYVGTTAKPLDEVSGSIFDNINATSSIDISCMAATLSTSLKVSQRLRVPPHVAQALFHHSVEPQSQPQDEDNPTVFSSPPERVSSSSLSTQRRLNAALSPDTTAAQADNTKGEGSLVSRDTTFSVADDTSYSVYGNRVRVGADGQVEVRTKPQFNIDMKFSQSTSKSTSSDDYEDDEDDYHDDYQDDEDDDDDDDEDDSTEDDDDRYSTHYDSSLREANSLLQGPPSLSTATSYEPSEADHRPPPKQTTPKHANITITTKKNKKKTASASPKAKPAIQETESYLEDWLDQAMISTDADGVRLIPSKVHQQQQQQFFPDGDDSILPSSSMSTITQPTIISDAQTSQVYTVDSRGQLFDEEASNNRGTILPPHLAKQKLAKQQQKQQKKGKSEDLDAWLDSVIS